MSRLVYGNCGVICERGASSAETLSLIQYINRDIIARPGVPFSTIVRFMLSWQHGDSIYRVTLTSAAAAACCIQTEAASAGDVRPPARHRKLRGVVISAAAVHKTQQAAT